MERVTKNLNAAIATMRAACDDAERRTKDGDDYSVQSVLHALAWGMANATSSIERAMAAVEDEHDKHAYTQAAELEKLRGEATRLRSEVTRLRAELAERGPRWTDGGDAIAGALAGM